MATKVGIEWYWLEFQSSDTLNRVTQKLIDEGADSAKFPKSVYVIRLQAPFSILYPNNHTPTIYIGEGNLLRRLNSHRRWLERLQGLGYPFPIHVACCFPRVRKNPDAYKVFEAHLLNVFHSRYGSLPLKNSDNEYMAYDHQYDRVATKGVLGPGSGTKHTWAIRPLPSNPFRSVFEKTHAAI